MENGRTKVETKVLQLRVPCLQFLGDPVLGNSQVFVVHVSRKGSLVESSECGCLSHHATIVESLRSSLRVV